MFILSYCQNISCVVSQDMVSHHCGVTITEFQEESIFTISNIPVNHTAVGSVIVISHDVQSTFTSLLEDVSSVFVE